MSCKIYFAITLPASESAAGRACLVVTRPMRAPAGRLASVGRLPPTTCQELSDGGPAGGGSKTSLRVAETGKIGGSAGGGGKEGERDLDSLLLVNSVSACSALLDAGEYSQHGSTL